MSQPSIREILRCLNCGLVQFLTKNGNCRKCFRPLPVLTLYQEGLGELDPLLSHPAPKKGRRHATIAGNIKGDLTCRISSRLKQYRQEHLMSQLVLANIIGIPRTYLSRIERRRLAPGIVMINRLCRAIGIDVTEVVCLNRETDDNDILLLFQQLPPQSQSLILGTIRSWLGM